MENQNTQSLIQKVSKLASEFLDYFEIIHRESDDRKIYTLQRGAPSKLRDLVRQAHGDFLPDDFRYDTIHSALCAFVDYTGNYLEDVRVEPNLYNSELLCWISSNLHRVAYCDEAIQEFGLEKVDLITIITYGQQLELDEIVASVRESLISICENEDDEDTGG